MAKAVSKGGSGFTPGSLACTPTELELTVRAILTGMVVGALLAPCNVYAGLEIGWSFNMSVAAALVGFGFWGGARRTLGTPEWGILESNVNQTAASSAAAIAGAGLVAPIPALTLLTGRELPYATLVVWVFVVSLVGVVAAIAMRRRMLEVDRLAFPAGIATAETLKEMYARGAEASVRVRTLLASGVLSAFVKLAGDTFGWLSRIPLPGALAARGALATNGLERVTFANLGFAFDPSLLLMGFGAIIGVRAGASLLVGAVAAWGVLGPVALAGGWADPGASDPGAAWFGSMVEWLLWPGVAMMVSASIASFVLRVRRSDPIGPKASSGTDGGAERRARGVVPWKLWTFGLGGVGLAAVIAQAVIFGIPLWVGAIAVAFTFALALVAGRVAGETGITPIGAMGKVTQLGFAAVSPADVTTNLMAANVTGGAASQCADMLHDLKTGLMVGSTPKVQAVAQIFGVFAGSFSGSLTYLVLIPDPQSMLLTDEWPAPAVATWKAVAEVFRDGFDQLPAAALPAMLIGLAVGALLAAAEAYLPDRWVRWIPSPTSMGLAFVLPAWNSISMFLGAVLAELVRRRVPTWRDRVIVVAAGLVAGESLAGVVSAFARMLG